MKNKTFAKLLGKRGMTVERLASQIFSNRISVTLVLLGKRKGGVTWENLKRVLEPEELDAAKSFADAARKMIAAQKALKLAGYDVDVNGIGDAKTMAATADYQAKEKLDPTGFLDGDTLARLLPAGADLYEFKPDKHVEPVPA